MEEMQRKKRSRNAKASWSFKEFVELVFQKNTLSLKAHAASLTGDVLALIEQKGLCYSTKLKKYMGVDLPWMVTCLKSLPADQLVLVSCLAFIQNGDYVDFSILRDVLVQLPINQCRRYSNYFLNCSNTMITSNKLFLLQKSYFTMTFVVNLYI